MDDVRMRKLTDRQRRFVELFAAGVPKAEAYVKAGYSPIGAGSGARRLVTYPQVRAALEEMRRELRERLMGTLEQLGAEAVERLGETMRRSESETLRLAAARDILDRIGLGPQTRQPLHGSGPGVKVLVLSRALNREERGERGGGAVTAIGVQVEPTPYAADLGEVEHGDGEYYKVDDN